MRRAWPSLRASRRPSQRTRRGGQTPTLGESVDIGHRQAKRIRKELRSERKVLAGLYHQSLSGRVAIGSSFARRSIHRVEITKDSGATAASDSPGTIGGQEQGLGSSEGEKEGVEGVQKDMRVETLKGPVGQEYVRCRGGGPGIPERLQRSDK